MELVDGALEKSKERKSLPIEQIMKLPAAERHRLLEEQAKDAAKYYEIEGAVSKNAAPTAIELLRLPAKERRKRLREQAKIAAPYYRNDPDLNFEIHDDILEY